LEIFWKINSQQTVGIYKNNLDRTEVSVYRRFCSTRSLNYTYSCTVFSTSVTVIISLSQAEWRKLHNEELNDLYSSPNIIRVIKSRRIRWAGHVARMGRGGVHTIFWWGYLREGDHLETQGVDGRTILKWTFKK
jgi:hypothetical protein